MYFIYSPSLLKLKQIVFKNSGIVYIDKPEEPTKEFIKELQEITSTGIISAFLFRDHRFEEYTADEWKLMYMQYAYTYGFATQFESAVLFEAIKDKGIDSSAISKSSDNVTIEPECNIQKLINQICESNIPLRENQLNVIYATPIEYLLEAFNSAKFVIKETKNIILTILFKNGSEDLQIFRDFDSIVRFIAANYAYDRKTKEPLSDTKLDKTILSNVDMKIPTSIKKSLLNSINKIKVNDKSVAQLKQYQQFWKRIFQQLAYAPEAKMTKRFPFAFEVKEKLYGKTLHTDNTEIEAFRKAGDLGTAFSIELGNPGQMLRRLLSYLRYPNGTVYASDTSDKKTKCLDDVKEVIEDSIFDSAIYRASPKLLLKMLELLKQEWIYQPCTLRKVNGGRTRHYSKSELPAVNKEFAKTVVEKINKVLAVIKKEDNEKLGKVYLDLDKAKLPVQFSGRLDTTDAMSGAYYPSGSQIDLTNIIDNLLKKDETKTINDVVLRSGIAWRGESTDLDLSTNVYTNSNNKAYDLFYGNNKMTINNEIIGISSGDVTHCNKEQFSAELIDFKFQSAKDAGLIRLVNTLNTFSGKNGRELEAYFFIEVLTDFNSSLSGNRLTNYDMQNAVVAVKVNCDQNYYCGFEFNLETMTLNVINKDVPSSMYRNVSSFPQSPLDKNNFIYINDILNMMIEPEQLVAEISDADTVITTNQFLQQIDGKKVYNLATKSEEAQELYM